MTIRTRSIFLPAALSLAACSGGGSSGGPSGGGGAPGQITIGSNPGPGKQELGVLLQNVDRNGSTLLFTVQGSDPAGQTTEAHVQLLDAAGAPVVAFDTDWDGLADSAEQRLHFDASTLGQKTFTQTITLPGLFGRHPDIASAVVALSDTSGNLSPWVSAALETQKIDESGQTCDPAAVTDRCDTGLSCTGKPATCQTGAPPSLTTVAYFGGASPAQLFAGSAPGADLSTITVNFLDGNGQSLTIDLSGDNDFASSIVLDASEATGTNFFFESDPTPRFVTLVPKISAVPTDTAGRTGAPVIATLASQPVRGNGQSCDPQGFTACSAGLVCSPGVVGTSNTCGGLPRLQSAKCMAAPATASGVIAGWGAAAGASLWDPPAGCAVSTAVGHPEGVVTLKLGHAASSLTISTAVPETDFDTILYVLPGCPADSTGALGCNDNAQGFASTVHLTNVAAGTYLVVVDSAEATGGHFGLSITSP